MCSKFNKNLPLILAIIFLFSPAFLSYANKFSKMQDQEGNSPMNGDDQMTEKKDLSPRHKRIAYNWANTPGVTESEATALAAGIQQPQDQQQKWVSTGPSSVAYTSSLGQQYQGAPAAPAYSSYPSPPVVGSYPLGYGSAAVPSPTVTSPYAGYLEKQIATYPVMIYTLSDCIPCRQAKQLLAVHYPDANAHYLELSGNEPWQQQLQMDIMNLTGINSFPYIFVCGQYIGGRDDLYELHNSGALRKMVSQCLPKTAVPKPSPVQISIPTTA